MNGCWTGGPERVKGKGRYKDMDTIVSNLKECM